MVKQIIKMSELKKLRLSMNHSIENALEGLGWDRAKLAQEYGVHMREGTYSKMRISQLINVNKGEEENSENLLNWMLEKIKENK